MVFVIHDLACDVCDHREYDAGVDVSEPMPLCPSCHLPMCIRWDISRRGFGVASGAAIQSDRAVVYKDPRTGKVAYPGRDTEFTRRKYEGWGYQRQEFTTLRELDKFCAENKLVNEKANYNSGNGVN